MTRESFQFLHRIPPDLAREEIAGDYDAFNSFTGFHYRRLPAARLGGQRNLSIPSPDST